MVPCSTTKDLYISFTPPTPAPAGGYIVKWRPVGETGWNIVAPTPTSSPVIVAGVPACANIEGTVQTNCGGGVTGTISTFFVAGAGFPALYSLINNSYCSGNSSSSITLNGKAGDTVVLKLESSAILTYDGIGAGGSRIEMILTAGSTSNTANTNAIMSSSGLSTGSVTITITMPANSITISTNVAVLNASNAVSTSSVLKVVSVNGVNNTAATSVCIGSLIPE